MRRLRTTIATVTIVVLSGGALAACGTEGVSVSDPDSEAGLGAELFAESCAGCHTLSAAGAQGSGLRALRVQGPNLDQRHVTYEDALFAIRNGGASGAVMPQNIVVGEDAEAVARFLDEYTGTDIDDPPVPGPSSSDDQS